MLRRAPERELTQPLSPALAPALGASAGALLALGGIGTWVRETVVAEGAEGTPVDAIVGSSEPAGWVLLVAGILAAGASLGWIAHRKQLRRMAAWAGALVVLAGVWSVVAIDRRAAALAAAASGDPSFEAYHAGFGWGAWLLVVAAIAGALSLLAGWLRGIDARGRT